MDNYENQIQPGFVAYDSDGEKIGDVQQVGAGYFVVAKGLIFVKDLYVPFSAVRDVDPKGDSVDLGVRKDDVDGMGWDQPPAEAELSSEAGSSGSREAFASTTTQDADESFRVPVHEEELSATTRERQAGEVRVGKRVVEDERELDVPVTHEEVDIRRVAVDRQATDADRAFDDGDTIRVPVRAEEVEVRREPRVVEEVEISKRPVTETRRVSDTVRREEVDVDDAGLVGAGSGASAITGTNLDEDDDEERRNRSNW
jgi:uncharacterized protein (TIGR02271 family)